MDFSTLLLLAAAAFFVYLLFKLFTAPLRWAVKLLLHAAFGFALLFLLNLFGSLIGITLELTLVNAVIAGVFGVPGIIVLLILKLLF